MSEDKKVEKKEVKVVVDAMEGVTSDDSTENIDYNKIVDHFGCKLIEPELLERFEKITGQRPHHWLRRGLYFSHRNFDELLSQIEKGAPFFLYTGRGPSGGMHCGHLVPFIMNAYLQKVFKCPMIIQMTDDEKFLLKDLELEDTVRLMYENVKDIIACGFDPERTFIFSDYYYMGTMYPVVCKIRKALTMSQIKGCFGFKPSDNIGKWSFPPTQMSPCFSQTFPGVISPERKAIPIPKDMSPEQYRRAEAKRKKEKKRRKKKKVEGMFCLIPCAIDQDPYFRMTRDIAHKIGYQKPHTLYSKFMSGLKGPGSKMSTSDPNSAIFLTDSKNQIKKKINKFAFSGGKETAEEQKEFGADVEVDVSIHYLRIFMEDDEKLAEITEKYAKGELMTGQVKKILIEVMQKLLGDFQERRKKVTDEVVLEFMRSKPLKYEFKLHGEKEEEEEDE